MPKRPAAFQEPRVALVAAILAAALSGCTTAAAPAGDPYDDAIYRSSVFVPQNVHALRTVAPGDDPIDVVTWTTRGTATQYYHPGLSTPIGIDLWVTIDPEVRERCAAYPDKSAPLTLRLQQLLGLPGKDEERVFVRLTARRSDIFRPCPDPDPAKDSCGNSFPATVSTDYRAWFAQQVLSRYQEPFGYPWTHLGYTYDWAPEASRVGASEFVIRKGSTVAVKDVVATDAFCHAPLP